MLVSMAATDLPHATWRSGGIAPTIVNAAALGDRGARRQLAAMLMGRVRSVVFYLEGGDPEAEDDAQVAMMEILASLGTYRKESSIERWAERIAVRTARRGMRRRRWRASFMDRATDDRVDRAADESASDGERDLAAGRLRSRVLSLLARIGPDQRAAVVLRLVYGYTIAEIASLTETNRFTVDYRLRRGRERLRRLLADDPLFTEYLGDTRRRGDE
jgi:RNA polymerase sigma-70 factor (ECF subfamily)